MMPLKLSKEITDKYSIQNNTFIQVAKSDPKDKIEVEIGDIKQPDFYPQVKIQRWDNEVNCSIRLITDEKNPVISTEGDKIKWVGDKIESHFYNLTEGEGGYEFEVIEKEPTFGEYIDFTINIKDLVFYPQPELTQKEKDEGAFRPENVVNSLAVYAKTPKTNWTGGKEYKCAKVGHIFRGKTIDVNGNWAWTRPEIILNSNGETGILRVWRDKDFLDKAVYPVRHAAGLEFGYHTEGGSAYTGWAKISTTYYAYRVGNIFTGAAGTLDKLSANLSVNTNETADTYAAINTKDSGGAGTHGQVTLIERTNLAITTTKTWYDFTAASEALTAVDYILSIDIDPADLSTYRASLSFDAITTATCFEAFASTSSTIYATSKENPWVNATDNASNKYSIYATYTAGGQTLSQTCTETITPTDTTSKLQVLSKAFLDVLTSSDIVTKSQGMLKTLSETLTATEITISNVYQGIKTFVEDIVISDIMTAGRAFSQTLTEIIYIQKKAFDEFFATLSEVITTTDATISKTWHSFKTFVETITTSDTITAIRAFLLNLSETLEIIDDLVADWTEAVTNFIANLSETITTSDTFTKITSFSKTLSDIITTTESWVITKINAFYLVLTEEISISDTLSKIQGFISTLTETIGLTDILTRFTIWSTALTETFTLSDVLDSIKVGLLNLSETIGLTDTLSKLTTWTKTFTESTTISDSLSKLYGKILTLTETITTSDVISFVKQAILNLSETLNLSDTLSKLTKWAKSLTEVSIISDIIKIGGNWWNRMAKNISSWTFSTKHTSSYTEGTKHSATWTEPTKHTSSYTEKTKNISTWKNQDKSN